MACVASLVMLGAHLLEPGPVEPLLFFLPLAGVSIGAAGVLIAAARSAGDPPS
jgi:hypothetical protein